MIALQWDRTSEAVLISGKQRKGSEGEVGVRETQDEEIERKRE